MQKLLILIFSLSCILLSCQKKECQCNADPVVIRTNDSLIQVIKNRAIKEYWDRFDEPVLYSQNKEFYRLKITVLLADYCKIYRVEKEGDDHKLYVKEYAVSTTTAFRADSLIRNYSKMISVAEWRNITAAFEKNCFWTMPLDVERNHHILDGSSWLLEGFSPGGNLCTPAQYQLVDRQSPDSSGFTNICDQFIALDSLKITWF
jgi:hypothetical protein